MPAAVESKYIAEGFTRDAERLLEDFASEKSVEFSAFALKWKEMKFGAIYLGRREKELQQFTHEIYQLSLKFLLSSLFYVQVGAVYLLYALFRNQILKPPVRIRIMFSQFEKLREIQVLAETERYKTLHYAIEFMKANAFDFVFWPTLCGPRSGKGIMECDKSDSFHISCEIKDLKADVADFLKNDVLLEIHELTESYTKLKKSIRNKQELCSEPSTDFNKSLQKFSNFVGPGSWILQKSGADQPEIGIRRSKLKADAFSKRASFRQLNASDSEEADEPPVKVKRKRRQDMSRKKNIFRRNKVGRPTKVEKLERLLAESTYDDGDDNHEDDRTKCYVRRRGPPIRGSYLDDYPVIDSKIKPSDFINDSGSSEESSEEA